ncbi:MAG: exo-alpha-sialidase [bacterium]|nr:exo-alpha-sialidase [bacterium]
MKTRCLLIAVVIAFTMGAAMAQDVQFKTVGSEPEPERYRACRSMIVGPWKNQPEEYEGYNGFVGWSGVTRLRSGRWFVTFTSGTWHATPPWTEEIRQDPECLPRFEEWHKIGLPDIRAPLGGRCHIMHSDDEGLTWSRPVTLADTEDDDRHPAILELDDGTLICTFFTYRFPRETTIKYITSKDGGETWTEPTDPLGKPVAGGFGNGPVIQLQDGALVWVTEGKFDESHEHSTIGVLRSEDRGKTFEVAAVVKRDHSLHEPTVAELPGGRLVMVIRREGDLCWSDDGGKTWEHSDSTGWDIYDPHLVVLPNGVLACFHGSYKKGGIRVLLSPDGGETWNGPGEGYGYSVDSSVYGYSHPMVLPDGTVYLTYLHTGGHRPEHARTQALWGLRIGIHDDAGGIDILPAPGSSAAEQLDGDGGGDPELGDKM